jgi:hypothetical protein
MNNTQKKCKHVIKVKSSVNMFLSYEPHLLVHSSSRKLKFTFAQLQFSNSLKSVIGLVLSTERKLCVYQSEDRIRILLKHFTAKDCVSAPNCALRENRSCGVQTENQLNVSTKIIFIQTDKGICDHI